MGSAFKLSPCKFCGQVPERLAATVVHECPVIKQTCTMSDSEWESFARKWGPCEAARSEPLAPETEMEVMECTISLNGKVVVEDLSCICGACGWMGRMHDEPKYCPSCGAKVVEPC